MALAVSILNDLKRCLQLAESLKSAEKSKLQSIEDEANALFKVFLMCHDLILSRPFTHFLNSFLSRPPMSNSQTLKKTAIQW